ncbi:uncharacterized protein LOC130649537 [Hydractinia symbiolongicarpus]|uniref:uncharacterized protein LOC130649537 n=1 Tax=Hydractinia symbiolongicarpus TaxID=13093 RepID=UPI0025514E33|nr:uncharacterized protein LOC130649537 [Hydractinia symbiolongicarpus]
MFVGTKILDCHHGKDRNLNLKLSVKEKREKELQNDHGCRRKHTRVQDCKKFDCPAQVIITEMIEFPEYPIHLCTLSLPRENLTALWDHLLNKYQLLLPKSTYQSTEK